MKRHPSLISPARRRAPSKWAWLHWLAWWMLLISPLAGADQTTLDSELTAIITQHGLSGDPSLGRDLPSIEEPLAQLGMKLFFSKALGGDMDSACVSCHHPTLGGGDGLSMSIGVDAEQPDLLGPGRRHAKHGVDFDGSPTVPRNAPSTFNIGLWDSVLFHDGRIESLSKAPRRNGAGGGIRTPDTFFGTADPAAGASLVEAQTRFPVTTEEEMRGYDFEADRPNDEVRRHLAQRLAGVRQELNTNAWLAEFRLGLHRPRASAEELITFANIARAIADYERSQVFVGTAWKDYLNGKKSAISEAAKKGALLFFRSYAEAGAHCAVCHQGDFFTDEQFHVIAIPQIGRGKEVGLGGHADFGRFGVSMNAKDRYAFRTPTLLNVEVTAPYGHDGAYTTLEAVVRHHLNPRQAVARYDGSQLDPAINISGMRRQTQKALNKLLSLRAEKMRPVLRDVRLSERQVGYLVAFLKALTDPCVKDPACLEPWIPRQQDADPDRLRVGAAAR